MRVNIFEQKQSLFFHDDGQNIYSGTLRKYEFWRTLSGLFWKSFYNFRRYHLFALTLWLNIEAFVKEVVFNVA